jgi:hypothetical protein
MKRALTQRCVTHVESQIQCVDQYLHSHPFIVEGTSGIVVWIILPSGSSAVLGGDGFHKNIEPLGGNSCIYLGITG